MKKMMLLFAFIIPVLSASAQFGMKKTRVATKPPEVIAAAVANNLNTKLSLSDDQKSKATALIVASIKQVRAIRLQKTDAKTRQQQIAQLANDHSTKLRALLNADQLSKLDALKNKSAKVNQASAIPVEDEAAADLKQVLE